MIYTFDLVALYEENPDFHKQVPINVKDFKIATLAIL